MPRSGRRAAESGEKKVRGSLSRLDPLRHLEMLRVSARLLRPGRWWRLNRDDGRFVRKRLVVFAEPSGSVFSLAEEYFTADTFCPKTCGLSKAEWTNGATTL
jgi:hypothetical protein